ALDRIHAFIRLEGERELPDSTLSLRYGFVHVLYQNAAYASLTGRRKVSLSAAVAAALVEHHGERSSEIALELALLFEAARDFGRAADYFLMAAKNTAALYANQEAMQLCHRAIASAEKLKGEGRFPRVQAAASQLALLYERTSRFTDAAEAFDTVEKAAAEARDLEGQVEAICGKANALFIAKRMEETREQVRRGFELARLHGSKETLAAVELVHSSERLCAGDFAAALERFDPALETVRKRGMKAGGLLPVMFRGALHAWRLECREALQVLEWGYEKARETGSVARILQSFFLRGVALGHAGQLGSALASIHEAQRLAELNGERFTLSRLPNTLGWLHRELLDLEGALTLDLEGARLAAEVGDNEAAINSHINAGQIYLLLGEPQQAWEHLEKARDLLSRYEWFTWVFQIRLEAELASFWIARGDLAQAAAHASQSLQITERSLSRKHMAL